MARQAGGEAALIQQKGLAPNDYDAIITRINKEGSDLVIPPTLRAGLNAHNIPRDPTCNIKAGLGYLLTKLAIFSMANVLDPSDGREYSHTVKAGDCLASIAKRSGTTVETLKAMNHQINTLKPGQIIKYKKASTKMIISGWRPVTTSNIAMKYNGGGDAIYQKKLEYCLSAIR